MRLSLYEARQRTARRGVTALMAMLFLMLITTLSLAMFHIAANNVQTSANYADLARAQAAAESGMRWTAHRFATMARPSDMAGTITPQIAYDLWNRSGGLRDKLRDDLLQVRDLKNAAPSMVAIADTVAITSPVPTDLPGATFTVVIRQLNVNDTTLTRASYNINDPATPIPANQRFIRVTATGTYRKAVRSVSMDFEIEKRAKFAVIGKVPIQIGRNTIVEGPIGMTTATKFPPVLILSDFMHFHDGLKTKITNFNTYLRGSSIVNSQTIKNHNGFDNRISTNNVPEYQAAARAGYKDVNGDNYIDEYDLFVDTFDTNKDGKIDKGEFTNSSGKLYDAGLFQTIDNLSPPLVNEDKNGNGFLDSDEDTLITNGKLDVEKPRPGFDNQQIDFANGLNDGYQKIAGPILLATTANAWQSTLSSPASVGDYFQGPIAPPETGQTPIKFGAGPQELIDLNPQNFEQAAENFRKKTGTNGGQSSKVLGRIENVDLAAADAATYSPPYVIAGAPAGNTTLKAGDPIPNTPYKVGQAVSKTAFDQTVAALKATPKPPPLPTSTTAPLQISDKAPFESTSWQATYQRPVFYGVHFRNVKIPKGINALFEDCTFEGVTFVEVERDVKNSAGNTSTSPSDGSYFAQKMQPGFTFNKDVALTAKTSQGFVNGNNLRFNNCIFEGPIGSNYATAYTHFANSWEFTGSTLFNNKVDQTATIVAPQTNIEMGSYTDPNKAPSTLVGVVVAGNLDIRGTSIVDGSILVTGDGAGNTTLGYFGASDGDTSTAVDLTKNGGSWGRLHIRYNPYRVMPDGINIAVVLTEHTDTYREGTR